MRRGKNVFWGVLFLVGAAALLVGKLGFLNGIGFWSILFSIGLVGVFLDGIVKKSWGKMLFALAFLAIVNADMLGIEKLVPWTVLGVAALGTIGLNMLFPLKHRHVNHEYIEWTGRKEANFQKYGNVQETEVAEENVEEVFGENRGEYFKSEVCGSSSVKYIQSNCLSGGTVESVFGTLAIYLEDVVLENQQATIDLDVVFGTMVVYVPADWRLVLNVSSVFGGVKEHGHSNPSGENVLTLEGDVVFGSLEVNYI